MSESCIEVVVQEIIGEYEPRMPDFLAHRRQDALEKGGILAWQEFDLIRKFGHGLKRREEGMNVKRLVRPGSR